MFFSKQISLQGIAAHMFSDTPSPVPLHKKESLIQRSISELRRHMFDCTSVESFVGPSFSSFKEPASLKKMPEIFSSIIVAHLVTRLCNSFSVKLIA